MKFVEQIERLQYLDKLIRKGSTGTPEELGRRLGISRSQLYNLIGYFNEIGMEVRFSRARNSFYYVSSGREIEIQFSVKIITDNNEHIIYGGSFSSHTITKMNINYYDQNYF